MLGSPGGGERIAGCRPTFLTASKQTAEVSIPRNPNHPTAIVMPL